MPERNRALVALEERYPLGTLSMANADGLLWENRARADEAYFNDYSWDWEENQAFLSDVRAMGQKYGGYVMLASAIIENWVADTYYRNPDPIIQDKRGNRDLSNMVSAMGKSLHAKLDSERKMRDALYDQSWAGFGMPWLSFKQRARADDAGDLTVQSQELVLKTLSPWHVRFDPRGREWDMSDHAYVRVLYFPTLSQMMAYPWLSEEDRARTVKYFVRNEAFDAFNTQRIDYLAMTDDEETDPDYMQRPVWQVWDRTKKLVFFQPAGAQFTLTPQPWPEEFEDADVFPFVYMPKNREAQNKKGSNGFIGVPDLRRIKPHLVAINRLESLFLESNANVIWKYMSPKGALTDAEKAQLYDDRPRRVIEYDPDNLIAMPVAMRNDFRLEDILRLVPQPELKETRHLAGIAHEMDMIAQIIGQSSGVRGGMPDTDTATDSVIINERLKARASNARNEAGKFYKELTRLMFLILKHRQELPIEYQMTGKFNEQVWREFAADDLRDLDLHFDFAVGSSEPRTREEELALRERVATILIPMLQAAQDTRGQKFVARNLVEMTGVHGYETYFDDEVTEMVKELSSIIYGVAKGEIPPNDKQATNREMELIAQISNQLLSTADATAMMAERNNANMPEQGGMGSMAKAPTPGEMKFDNASRGAAAAGAAGGMGNALA